MESLLHNKCPYCKSHQIIQDRHPRIGKIQYFCKTCKKYFSEDSLKGYPPSNVPFPVIAYLLYFRRRIPEFSNMRRFRPFVNYLLKYLKINKKDVSRQTVHHWIHNFDKYLDSIISFDEAKVFCHHRLEEISKVSPPVKVIPYRTALEIIERKYGKKTVIVLIKKDPVIFQELVEIVSKHGVFGWEFLEAGFGGVSVGSGSTKATG